MRGGTLLLPGLLALAGVALVGNGPKRLISPPPLPERRVMVGGMDDLDACLTVSKVTGLDPRGDNFLSLRSRPSTDANELGRLRAGQQVWVCDEAPGGWTGVLIAPVDGSLDCGVGTPIAERRAYGGSCGSGWVASRFLEVVAG